MIRAVLFDAFGTLFRPRLPVPVQYAELAAAYGLQVTPEEIKPAFKRAYREVASRHPLYGKYSSPPLHYEDWWGLLIENTLDYAGVAGSDLQLALPTLIPAMIERFASREGYSLPDDVSSGLLALRDLQPKLQLGIISNTDPRTAKVLESLEIVPDYIPADNVTLSWNVGHSKPSPEIYHAACKTLGVKPDQTLMVGDDLDEDYHSARSAGLQALLIKREANEADYVRRELREQELKNVEIITSFDDIPAWIQRHNSTA